MDVLHGRWCKCDNVGGMPEEMKKQFRTSDSHVHGDECWQRQIRVVSKAMYISTRFKLLSKTLGCTSQHHGMILSNEMKCTMPQLVAHAYSSVSANIVRVTYFACNCQLGLYCMQKCRCYWFNIQNQ